jgi:hypothetical protein
MNNAVAVPAHSHLVANAIFVMAVTFFRDHLRQNAMVPTVINDAKHWRDRAQEARLLAAQIANAVFKEAMLRIATDYDRLAQRAEERAKERLNLSHRSSTAR